MKLLRVLGGATLMEPLVGEECSSREEGSRDSQSAAAEAAEPLLSAIELSALPRPEGPRTSSVIAERPVDAATTGAVVPGGKLRARAARSGAPPAPTHGAARDHGHGTAGNTTGRFGAMNCAHRGGGGASGAKLAAAPPPHSTGTRLRKRAAPASIGVGGPPSAERRTRWWNSAKVGASGRRSMARGAGALRKNTAAEVS